MSKLTIIFGAGASHDVVDNSMKIQNSNYRPPLVGEIFNKNYLTEKAPHFPNLYGLASRVQRLGPKISGGKFEELISERYELIINKKMTETGAISFLKSFAAFLYYFPR